MVKRRVPDFQSVNVDLELRFSIYPATSWNTFYIFKTRFVKIVSWYNNEGRRRKENNVIRDRGGKVKKREGGNACVSNNA